MSGEYQTKDQYMIPLLMCFPETRYAGFEVRGPLPGKKEVWYLFSDENACENVIRLHFDGHLEINSLRLMHAIQESRSRYNYVK